MADVNGYGLNNLATLGFTVPTGDAPFGVAPQPPGYLIPVYDNPFNARLTPAVTYWYQMECTDHTTNAIATWPVQGAPDWVAQTPAALSAIAAASLATPVRNVRIVTRWETTPAG